MSYETTQSEGIADSLPLGLVAAAAVDLAIFALAFYFSYAGMDAEAGVTATLGIFITGFTVIVWAFTWWVNSY